MKYTIDDRRTGLLVPEGNPVLLADRICRVMEEPAERKKLVKAALAKVQQFSWPQIAQKILSVYRSLPAGFGKGKPKEKGKGWNPGEIEGFTSFPSGGFSSSPGESGCCWPVRAFRPGPKPGPQNP